MKVKTAKVRVKRPNLIRTFYEDTRLNFLRMIDSPRIMSEIWMKKNGNRLCINFSMTDDELPGGSD